MIAIYWILTIVLMVASLAALVYGITEKNENGKLVGTVGIIAFVLWLMLGASSTVSVSPPRTCKVEVIRDKYATYFYLNERIVRIAYDVYTYRTMTNSEAILSFVVEYNVAGIPLRTNYLIQESIEIEKEDKKL